LCVHSCVKSNLVVVKPKGRMIVLWSIWVIRGYDLSEFEITRFYSMWL
jgi:hypothetical protein